MIDHLSYSSLFKLTQCPHAWKLRYLDKVPETVTGRLIVGRCYHDAVANALSQKSIGLSVSDQEVADIFSSVWDKELRDKVVYDVEGDAKVEVKNIDWGEDDPGKLKDQGILLAKLYCQIRLPNLEVEKVEYKMQRIFEGVKFVGRADAKLMSGKIIDHKYKEKRMGEEELQRDFQSTSYAFLEGKPITMQFHQALNLKVRPKNEEDLLPIVEVERGEDDINWFTSMILAWWKVIQAGLFPPNPNGWFCSPAFCSYYVTCRMSWLK